MTVRDLKIKIFFFNDTATTEIYPLSLHDALPIYVDAEAACLGGLDRRDRPVEHAGLTDRAIVVVLVAVRSEEHTSELQSRLHLVCRLLLEKKTAKNISKRLRPIPEVEVQVTDIVA